MSPKLKEQEASQPLLKQEDERSSLIVRVDHRVESPNTLMGEHWKARAPRRRKEREATWGALTSEEPPTLPGIGENPLVVLFTRYAANLVDLDNLGYAFKSPRDTTAEWLDISDGTDESRVLWRYSQQLHREWEPVEYRSWWVGPQRRRRRVVFFTITFAQGVRCPCCGHIDIPQAVVT